MERNKKRGKRILCIWFPNWPIQRLVVDQPELERRSIILHKRDSRRGQLVTACSSLASKQGIAIGMPLSEACSLASVSAKTHATNLQTKTQNFIEPHVIEHDPLADLEMLNQLATDCEQFSPLVGLETNWKPLIKGKGNGNKGNGNNEQPEALLLDITNVTHLFDGEVNLVQKAESFMRQRRYLPRLSLADTVGAAWAISHAANTTTTIVPANQTEHQLSSLPVWTLRIPDSIVEVLSQLGIRTVGQLLNLPRDGLNSRFGEELLYRIDQALGAIDETIVATTEEAEFEAAYSIEHPTARRETIQQIVLQLMQQLSQQLYVAGRGALQIECHVNCSGGRKIQIQVGLFQPRADADHLMQLAAMQLDTLILPSAATAISIKATTTARLAAKQQELWTDRHRDAPVQLAWLVEKLSSRLGQDRVSTARLQSAIQPERACRYVTATGKQVARRVDQGTKQSERSTAERPLWMPALPIPLNVTTNNGSPTTFQNEGKQHQIARYWGPERIETAWWRGKCVRRDYYRIETKTGDRYWIFQRLNDRNWFLHGFLG